MSYTMRKTPRSSFMVRGMGDTTCMVAPPVALMSPPIVAPTSPTGPSGPSAPGSTSTSTSTASPTSTSTSTQANTAGNVTVTGGAGAGATTTVTIRRAPFNMTSSGLGKYVVWGGLAYLAYLLWSKE